MLRHLRGELVAVARHVAGQPSSAHATEDAFSLLNWALKVSLAVRSPIKQLIGLNELMIQIVDSWPAFAGAARLTFQQLCDEMPPDYARELWPALLRLRTEP